MGGRRGSGHLGGAVRESEGVQKGGKVVTCMLKFRNRPLLAVTALDLSMKTVAYTERGYSLPSKVSKHFF